MKQAIAFFSVLAVRETTGFAPLFGSTTTSSFLAPNKGTCYDVVDVVRETTALRMASEQRVGVFFGTSTGSTETVACALASEFGNENVAVAGPFEIDALTGSVQKTFDEYDCLLVGTPTWNTGADTERSGTGWDEIYYGEMQDLKIEGKKVAVFGLGDSVSYGENYADASGELHDVFESLGCKMFGYTSQDGYEHEESKAIRGDKFCGLLLDAVNQEELTDERVKNWVSQLKTEGFVGGDDGASSSSPSIGVVAPEVVVATPDPASSVVARTSASDDTVSDIDKIKAEFEKLEKENASLRRMLENVEETVAHVNGEDENGFVPHLNPKSGRTMWVSPNGKSCYYTASFSEYTP